MIRKNICFLNHQKQIQIPHDFLLNWDLLINACLQQDAAKRPASLVNIIDAVRQQPKNFVKDKEYKVAAS